MPPDRQDVLPVRASSPGSTASFESTHASRLTPGSDSDDDGDDLGALEEADGLELTEFSSSATRSKHGLPARHQADPATESGGEEAGDDSDGDDGEAATSSHRRRSSVASFELYTPDEERAVRRKLDTRLVLFVALLYMMSFLDRSNIGNAKVAGLSRDLHLTDAQFSWLLSAFYITYILFEWMTLCYRLFPAHIYIACCVLGWGVVASLQSLATGFPYLLVLRALLGIAEAAFVGMPIFLSFFFRRDELALRVGLFISAAPLAEAFASSLAYAIVSLGDRSAIASWRLLFLIEGFPACIVAVWTWYWIPDGPSTARWLSPRERRIATLRMRHESGWSNNTTTGEKDGAVRAAKMAHSPRHKRKFQWSQVLRALRDPKSYLTASMFFCCNVAFSSMPVFLPSIVHSMGYSTVAAQGLSAPPFLFAFAVVLLTAFSSDRYAVRSTPMMLSAALAVIGYTIAALASTLGLGPIWRYLAVYPICAGFFSAVTVVITWTVNNQATDEGKGTGMAILNVFGQMGPLLGTRLYPDADAPFYIKGNVICAIAMGMVVVLAYALRRVLIKENARRRSGQVNADEGEALVGSGRGASATGQFMYII